MAHMTARMSNLAEDVVGVGAGVEAGAAAVGERLRLALICRTTVTTAATTENLCLSVDVAEDVGVAEGVGNVGVVEPTLGCLAGGAVVESSSGCAAVGDVSVVELLSRCVAEAVGAVVVDVGVALDDHYHRSINGRPFSRQNESVCISGDETLGDKTLDQIPPRRPIASSVDLLAPLGSTWSSIDLWTSSHAPIARHAFGRKSEFWVRRRTLLLVCAAAKAKSPFPSSRVVLLNRKRIGLGKRTQPRNSDGMHEPTTLSFRSALKGPISNYLSSVASRSYASTEPLPISWAPSFPTPGMSPALPSFTSLTVITRSSDAKKSFLLALTVHPSSAPAFSACSRILSSTTTPTSTSSTKRAVDGRGLYVPLPVQAA
jgi:hypothetical protein